MKTFDITVRRADDKTPLIDFVARQLKLSRRAAKALLDRRSVSVNGTRIWMARHPLAIGDHVTILKDALSTTKSAEKTMPILFHDDHCLVALKPAGILSCGPKSLETMLRRQTRIDSLKAVHRLDRDTSGCLIFACNDHVRELFVDAFRAKSVTKVYHAIVHGHMKRGEHRVSKPIGGQTAVSNVRVLDASATATHVAVSIETGRTHQIRIHLASVRHPVMGDRKYTSGIAMSERHLGIPRQMLHAQALRFEHPITHAKQRLTAPLPADFKACLRAFKLT